jgi:hypothetical protein
MIPMTPALLAEHRTYLRQLSRELGRLSKSKCSYRSFPGNEYAPGRFADIQLGRRQIRARFSSPTSGSFTWDVARDGGSWCTVETLPGEGVVDTAQRIVAAIKTRTVNGGAK